VAVCRADRVCLQSRRTSLAANVGTWTEKIGPARHDFVSTPMNSLFLDEDCKVALDIVGLTSAAGVWLALNRRLAGDG